MNNKVVLFKNWTTEDFKWKWDGVEYEFKSDSVTPLPEYLFNHFSKHLANRELNKLSRPIYLEDPVRLEMIEKCRQEEKEVSPVEAQVVQINSSLEEEKKEEVKKRGRPKKEIKEEVKQSEEFEGLNN